MTNEAGVTGWKIAGCPTDWRTGPVRGVKAGPYRSHAHFLYRVAGDGFKKRYAFLIINLYVVYTSVDTTSRVILKTPCVSGP